MNNQISSVPSYIFSPNTPLGIRIIYAVPLIVGICCLIFGIATLRPGGEAFVSAVLLSIGVTLLIVIGKQVSSKADRKWDRISFIVIGVVLTFSGIDLISFGLLKTGILDISLGTVIFLHGLAAVHYLLRNVEADLFFQPFEGGVAEKLLNFLKKVFIFYVVCLVVFAALSFLSYTNG
ncbi:MAG: hypothetical protein WC797_00550 [Candidatus Paceibacterota bacterium]|jgi:hypothetical protein